MAGTFPSLKGLMLNVKRIGPIYPVKVQTSSSGKEQRAIFASAPRYKYVLEVEFLNASRGDVTSLVNLLLTNQGQFGFFTYVDPVTSSTMNVRLDTDAPELEQFASGYFKVATLPLISVL